jgi:hypothetical protein
MKLIDITAGFEGLALHFALDDRGNVAKITSTPKYGAAALEVSAALREAAEAIEKFALERAKEAAAARQQAIADATKESQTTDPALPE